MTMSGGLRMSIGPIKARLLKAIGDGVNLTQLRPFFSAEDPVAQQLQKLNDTKYALLFEKKKVDAPVTQLREKNQEWILMINGLDGDAQKTEMAHYTRTADGPDGYLAIITTAEERCLQIETMTEEIDHFIKRLDGQNEPELTPHMPQQNQGQFQIPPVVPTHVKLPKLALPFFDGNPLQWKQFWDAFESSVHTQNIPNIQKFNYLRGSLKGVAHIAIEGFSVTNDTYLEAIDTLKKRFGQTQVIKNALYAQIANIPPTTNKVFDLRNTTDKLDQAVRQLKALGEDVNHPFLVQAFLQKLPHDTRIKMEETQPPNQTWTVDALRTALWRIITIQETVQMESRKPMQGSSQSFQHRPTQRSFQPQQSFAQQERNQSQTQYRFNDHSHNSASYRPPFTSSTAAMAVTANKGRYQGQTQHKPRFNTYQSNMRAPAPCAFCNEAHKHDECKKFNTMESRQQQLYKEKRCFNCLYPGHQSKDCHTKLKRVCLHCKATGSHNTALCPTHLSGRQGRIKPVNVAALMDSPQQFTPKPQVLPNTSAVSINAVISDKTVSEISVNSQTNTTLATAATSTLLLTATTQIVNPTDTDKESLSHIFLDSGSQRTFITNKLAEKLQLPVVRKETLSVHTFTAKKPQTLNTTVVSLKLILQDGNSLTIEANAIPQLTAHLDREPLTKDDMQILKSFTADQFADSLPLTHEMVVPEIMIGLNYFFDLLGTEPRHQLPSGLYLIPSKLGLLIGGRQQTTVVDSTQAHTYAVYIDTQMHQCQPLLNQYSQADQAPLQYVNVEDFWSLESIGVESPTNTTDDEVALAQFNKTIDFHTGRYYVKWPWKAEKPDLPTNYGLALGRFKSLIRRFQVDDILLQKYRVVIEDQLQKGIIEKVCDTTVTGELKHYLPHHPVETPSKSTTKVRIVYDASSKTNQQTNSLNDCLYRGPVFLPDLCGLLLRFRTKPIVLLADIEKAFLQISLQDEERDVTRFLWLKDPFKATVVDNIEIYRFCRVAFGVISSPFLLSATVKYHLLQADTDVARHIMDNIYVDNTILGVDSAEQAKNLYTEAKQIFNEASMNLREWVSNCNEFNTFVAASDRMDSENTKVLGIHWNIKSDVIKLQGPTEQYSETQTRRSVLKQVAQVFDPLGLASPVLLPAKHFIQRLWHKEAAWDDPVTPELEDEWRNILHELKGISAVQINRYVVPTNSNTQNTLMIFVDASQIAYAATVYIHIYDKDTEETTVNLLFSKNRLAPKKKLTIPRLELLAVLVGTRVGQFVQNELHIPIHDKIVWSDSECTLHWITSKKPLSVFVENRLKEIRNATNTTFRYVPTDQNPADLATRGCTVETLMNTELWWKGPDWMSGPDQTWPTWNIPPITDAMTQQVESETKLKPNTQQIFINSVQVQQGLLPQPLVPVKSFSSLKKYYRTTVYCMRFLRRLWKKLPGEKQTKFKKTHCFVNQFADKGSISATEMEAAQYFSELETQHSVFPEMYHTTKSKSQMQKQLNIQTDECGLLRCYGRLTNATALNQNAKFPKLLPKEHPLTKLIIHDAHQETMHSGTQQTLSKIRQQYWIPSGRLAVHKVVSKCVTCLKVTGQPFKRPVMPPLPDTRLGRTRPFANVGIDYFGPIAVKQGLETLKVWVCLFTCMVVRAVHLEPIVDMTTQKFLQCFRRFIARRGKPDTVISDNAPQFKLGQDTLDLVWSGMVDDSSLHDYCSKERIKWHYITEYAPWQGGFYERMVGLVKNTFKKAVGKRLLKYDEFTTILTETEAVVNSRPLTFVSNDLHSNTVLRPIDFLAPLAKVGIPVLNMDKTDSDEEYLPNPSSKDKLLQVWTQSQQYLDKSWLFFNEHYLLSLREKHNNNHKGSKGQKNTNPQLNEVVLIKEENQPRGVWRIGKIIHLHTGTDNLTRSADIMLPNHTVLTRPINLLYPMEVCSPADTELHNADTDRAPTDTSATDRRQNQLKGNRRLPITRDRIQTRSMSRTSAATNVTILSLLTLILLFIPVTMTSSKCDKGSATFSNVKSTKLVKISSPKCVTKGLVIYRKHDNTMCWKQESCLTGHLDGSGTCANKCPCPDWAFKCSYHDGSSLKSTGDINQIISDLAPNVCSFTADSRCNPQPKHVKLPQIQLYNGSKYFVRVLDVQWYEAAAEEYDCIGEGDITGSPMFCNKHDCSPKGAKFCYYKRNEIAYLVTQDGKIPIKAYGKVPATIYPAKEISPQARLCTGCELKCIKGGIIIQLVEDTGFLECCTTPFCYKVSTPNMITTIMFPNEVLIHDYEVTVKVWANGFLLKDFGIQCPSAPFCEMITCYFCWLRLANPQCSSNAALIAIFVAMYFASFTLYILIKLLTLLIRSCYYGSYLLYKFGGICIYFCHRAKNKAYNTTILPYINEDQDDNISMYSYHTAQEHTTNDSPINHSPKHLIGQKKLPYLTILALITLLTNIAIINGCSEVTTLTASQSVCSVQKDGTMECVLTEVTKLSLAPQGQDSCLLIKDPNGEPVGTLTLEVKKIQLQCQYVNEYYTRSYSMNHDAVKRCSGAGSCDGNKCGDVTTDTRIDELDSEANNNPGYTYCSESCGCAGCGCFYCTSGCMFYRVYAKPATTTTYEVFSCPIWKYQLQITARLTTAKSNERHNFNLNPGVSTSWKNMKMTVTSVSAPPVPILGSQFLTDGTRTIMVRASASGQPVSGTIGSLQCANKDKASQFDCYLPHDSCNCQTQETTVSCSCADGTIEPLFSKPDHLIPLITSGISIMGTGNKLTAEYNNIASMEMQVSLEGLRLSTKIQKNSCTIKPEQFGGCYSCMTAAKLRFTCKTDWGEAIAHVSCGTAEFSTICTPKGITATTALNFAQAKVKEDCKVRCPAGITKFQLEGNLVFIEKERLFNISNIIAGKSQPVDTTFDLGSLTGWLSGNWLISVIIIIIIFIVLAITVPLAPFILKTMIACVKIIATNGYNIVTGKTKKPKNIIVKEE